MANWPSDEAGVTATIVIMDTIDSGGADADLSFLSIGYDSRSGLAYDSLAECSFAAMRVDREIDAISGHSDSA